MAGPLFCVIFAASALLALPAHAEVAAPVQGKSAGQAAAALPEPLALRIGRSPSRFVDLMSVVIAGSGDPRGIDAEGLRRHVAVERADRRAFELARLLAADLDNDGLLSPDEVPVLAQALGARPRGLLLRAVRLADTDGSGRVDADEMRRHAQTTAMAELDAEDEAAFLGLAGFDLDADGWTSLDELAAVVAAVAASQKARQAADRDA